MMANKKLKFEDLVPNNTVGTATVTPTVTNMPSYTSLIKDDGIYTGAPAKVGFEKPKVLYTGGTGTGSGEGGGTGSGGGTGDTVPPMTYEEWYTAAKQNAESTRQSAINDARVEYNRSKSEYGNKAEALRNMGLTGAGYSDYLNGQAYAQMQGAIANANAEKASTIADIDAKYMDYLDRKTEAAKNVYATLYDSVKGGAYTNNDIDRLASEYGLSDNQIANLKAVRSEYAKQILSSGDYSMELLNELYPDGGTDYESYKKTLMDKYKGFDADWLVKDDGTMMNKSEAKEWINELRNKGISIPEDIDKRIEDAYKVTFTPGIELKRDNNANSRTGVEGNDIVITDGSTKYHVQYTGKEFEEARIAADARGVKENDVFMYNNKLYIYKNGLAYELTARAVPYANQYNKLVSKLKSSTSTKSEG
jgi:hypothetical protein